MQSSATAERISSLASQFPSPGLSGLPAIAFHYSDSPASIALILAVSGLGSITFSGPRALQAPSLVRFLLYPNQPLHLYPQTPTEHPLWARRNPELYRQGECSPEEGKGVINRAQVAVLGMDVEAPSTKRGSRQGETLRFERNEGDSLQWGMGSRL